MAEPRGLGLDLLTQITNVHWGGLHFLYSGADGMFGSVNGEEWKELEAGAVPAKGLAWVDGVWLATGSGGLWRSEDGGKTWQSADGPEFDQIAACETTTGGIFAGYKQDEEGDNEEVHISRDLGETWSKVLTVPTVIPFGDGDDGYEYAQVLSGCGSGIFLSTVKGDEQTSNGDGCVYVSMDGGGFGGRQQIWSGTTRHFDDPPEIRALITGYTAGAVGFDLKTKQFCLMGAKEEGFGPGGAAGSLTEYSIIYATGLGGSFSGQNEIIKYTRAPLATSYKDVAIGNGAAGGDGKFAGTYYDRFWSNPGPPLRADLVITFFAGGSGTATLTTVPDVFPVTTGAQVGPVCWKPRRETDLTTDTPEGTGTFACVAFGVDAEPGGVWIANDGSWQQTHNGQGFMGDRQGYRAALAVGKLSWLGSTDNGA